MPFYPKRKKKETFKTGILDVAMICVVFVCFTYAFFFDSFIPLEYENGSEVHSEEYWRETGDPRVPKINAFVIIGGLIMSYEAFLLTLEGKKRGRYLPWALYYGVFRYKVRMKIQEGKDQTREYLERRKSNR